MIDIVLATRNKGKEAEIRALLDQKDINLLSLNDFPQIGEIKEKGSTFEENALFKARSVARLTGKIALADDSGLSVEALGGMPGISSARFAGAGATDEQNNQLLLKEMKGITEKGRGATFICVIAVVGTQLSEYSGTQSELCPQIIVRGECPGIILEEGHGSSGFGYDPLFYYPPMGKTFSEMSSEEKNGVSHRMRAIAKLKEKLGNWGT